MEEFNYSKTSRSGTSFKGFRASQVTRTPFSQRQSFRIIEDHVEEDEIKSLFVNYFEGPYRASRVTPLSNFNYVSSALDKYKQKLTKLVKENPSCVAEIESRGENVIVNFQKVKKPRTRDFRDNPIFITIICTNRATQNEVTMYKCVLCSVDPAGDDHLPYDIVLLPLMLWKGSVAFYEVVNSFLAQHFKCNIWSISFRPVDLEWLIALFAVDEEHPATLCLTYITQFTELGEIVFKMDGQSVTDVVRQVIQADMKELTVGHVMKVMEKLKTYFEKLTRIKVDGLRLQMVEMAVLNVSVTGELRIKNHKKLLQVLRFLTHIAESLMYVEKHALPDVLNVM